MRQHSYLARLEARREIDFIHFIHSQALIVQDGHLASLFGIS
jgi:hypothetical protein